MRILILNDAAEPDESVMDKYGRLQARLAGTGAMVFSSRAAWGAFEQTWSTLLAGKLAQNAKYGAFVAHVLKDQGFDGMPRYGVLMRVSDEVTVGRITAEIIAGAIGHKPVHWAPLDLSRFVPVRQVVCIDEEDMEGGYALVLATGS